MIFKLTGRDYSQRMIASLVVRIETMECIDHDLGVPYGIPLQINHFSEKKNVGQ